MHFLKREERMNEMLHSLESLLKQHQLDEIEIYEEEGEDELYYMGYTVKKGEHVYMVHQPYVKNEKKELALKEPQWTIQSEQGESKGYPSLEDVFNQIKG
ncbi:MAG TPA: DUF5634 family protein [Bacillus sp. (in: firmicutes)]|nr:DUF5634 family protein [Bacillus sp. (in: firmicutes)]